MMNFDGTVISSILPPMPVKADLRAAQIRVSINPDGKFKVAETIVQAKIARSVQVLDWLNKRYDIAKEISSAKKEASKLGRACDVNGLRVVEGRVAKRYWEAYGKALPESLDFQGRMTSSHQNNASDPVNSALNYAYGFLEGECRRAINTVGLEPSVGFLHDFSEYQTKQSLVYDLQEPFRWVADFVVIRAFEAGLLDLHDFYFTGDDYRYRFEIEAKQRFITSIRDTFNSRVKYSGHMMRWDTVIQRKTAELGNYLAGKSRTINFAEPTPILPGLDSEELRCKILGLTQSKAESTGIPRSTLHYLRKKARSSSSFAVYRKVRDRL